MRYCPACRRTVPSRRTLTPVENMLGLLLVLFTCGFGAVIYLPAVLSKALTSPCTICGSRTTRAPR
jgi:hypothetical protein